jgi:preprotein translocase subunit SecA
MVGVGLLDKMLRAGEGKKLRQYEKLTAVVNSLEPDYEELSDAELRAKTDEFRSRLDAGEDTLDTLLPEAFAAVREASKRTLGQRHYDVQITGGAALHYGNIAEMRTGEGKTLVATLPSYLNALSGKGVHVVTVNDYLARRDSEWMGRVHHFLGMDVGSVLATMSPDQRRVAYAADITYGTNNEFGFDYLRDNMAWSLSELVQRGHNFAVVDEVDSILIDEARTPLIISGPANHEPKWYTEFARLVRRLHEEDDYEVDIKKRTVGVLESGVEKAEDWLGIENLYTPENTPLVGFMNNAIKAKELFVRDRDYVVLNGEVVIVDEHTGRILPGRRYNEGLHQAIEAKEGVQIKAENQTLATITLQNYFRMYDKLAGMTGTAATEAAEFNSTYSLGVVPIPTNRPNRREDMPDLVYRTEEAKFAAVVDDLVERHQAGQPVLVGTTSVEKSELLSGLLKKARVPHAVLNAKFHEQEAQIVAEAGRKGAVTVATNMAGRGTDIMLGGNPEYRAAAELTARGLSPVDDPDEYEAAWPDALAKAEESVAAEHDEVVELGGLYVLGTERHESRRIDNQLRGRSGRQGDPGETRFYLSLTDDLMRRFNSGMVDAFLTRFNVPDDVPIEAKMVTRAIASAQSQVEAQNAEIRKNVLKYDEVMNRQRTVIYDERLSVLQGEDLSNQVRRFIDDVVTSRVQAATAEGYPEDWDIPALLADLAEVYPVSVSEEELVTRAGGDRSGLSQDFLVSELTDNAQEAYDAREEQFGDEAVRNLERRVIMSVLDKRWREHLYEMDYLKEGIGLRAMAQKDPLIEYQREGYDLFSAMMAAIADESVHHMFTIEPEQHRPAIAVDQAPERGISAVAAGVITEQLAQVAGTTPKALDLEVTPNADVTVETAGAQVTIRSTGEGVLDEPVRSGQLQYSAPNETGGVDRRVESVTNVNDPLSGGDTDERMYAGTAKNAQCPCGSGRKYKRCHGAAKRQ